MPATLKSLAAELGVTPAAVSMALRNHPRISRGLRQRAKSLARKRGYVPNPAYSRAGGWKKRKTAASMPLAVVTQLHPAAGFGISTYLPTIERVAAAYGYQVQVHSCKPGQGARIGSILYARGIEAALIGPVFDSGFVRQFPWKQFCVVAIDAGHYRPPCHLVMPDIAGATFEAVRRALASGFRRVALYEFEEPVNPVDWADRFGAAAAAREMCESSGAKFFHAMGPPYDAAAFSRWVEESQPDIVLGQTPACYWWLRKLGNRRAQPKCIILQMDPSEKEVGFAGFVHDNESLATVAVRLLDSEVRNFERGRPAVITRQLVAMPWHPGRQAFLCRPRTPQSSI